MKFYGLGRQIVWDKENDKALCQFKDGELETEDERTISILQGLGYRSDDNAKTKQGNTKGQKAKTKQAQKEGE